MIVATVTSPAGDHVSVVDDKVKVLWGSVGPIVRALWVDGPIEDSSGFAGGELYRRAKRHGYKAYNQRSVNGPIRSTLAPFIERDLNGKRTFAIRLARIPEAWNDGRLSNGHSAEPAPQPRRGQRPYQVAETHTQVTCPLCASELRFGNLRRHLIAKHHQSPSDANRMVRLARTALRHAPALPAVVGHDNDDEEEPSVLNNIPAIDLMTGMLNALRNDKMVPIRALPTLQEWLHQTERVLVELSV